MPFSIRIEPDAGIVIATCSGALGLNDAKEGAMAVWREGGQPFVAHELEFLVGLSQQAVVALKNALENLPKQAKRLARWYAERDAAYAQNQPHLPRLL